jgi:hypothetical protein
MILGGLKLNLWGIFHKLPVLINDCHVRDDIRNQSDLLNACALQSINLDDFTGLSADKSTIHIYMAI